MLRAWILPEFFENVATQLILVGRVVSISAKSEGVSEEIMNSRSFQAQAQFLTATKSILQFLTSVQIVLALDHRFPQVNATAEPIIFQVKSVSLLDSGA